MKTCKNKKYWANSVCHSPGCILNLSGFNAVLNGVSCVDPEGYKAAYEAAERGK